MFEALWGRETLSTWLPDGQLRSLAYVTTNGMLMILLVVTTMLQVPGVVRVPTFHVHEQMPAESANVGANPCAVLGPDM